MLLAVQQAVKIFVIAVEVNQVSERELDLGPLLFQIGIVRAGEMLAIGAQHLAALAIDGNPAAFAAFHLRAAGDDTIGKMGNPKVCFGPQILLEWGE